MNVTETEQNAEPEVPPTRFEVELEVCISLVYFIFLTLDVLKLTD